MKTSSAILGQPTLRGFAKAVFAVLASVLLTCEVNNAQQKAKPRIGQRGATRRPQAGAEFFRSHIPPIIMEDGSLTIEADKFDEKGSSGSPDRPKKYKKSGFNRMRRVVISAYRENGIPVYYEPYDVSDGRWQINVFLEEETSEGSGEYTPVNTNRNKAQIVIRDYHEIEMDKDTLEDKKCEPTDHPVRKCRFKHAPYSGTRFRIRRVSITKGNQSKPEPVWPEGREKVVIWVFYNHPH